MFGLHQFSFRKRWNQLAKKYTKPKSTFLKFRDEQWNRCALEKCRRDINFTREKGRVETRERPHKLSTSPSSGPLWWLSLSFMLPSALLQPRKIADGSSRWTATRNNYNLFTNPISCWKFDEANIMWKLAHCYITFSQVCCKTEEQGTCFTTRW